MLRALMLDVDGVVVTGRPGDGLPWTTDLEKDLGLSLDALKIQFFAPHWSEIVMGRAELFEVLREIWPKLGCRATSEAFVEYWFANDARLDRGVLEDVGALRAAGLPVWLATNQEHSRAAYLMDALGLGAHVDGILYSAKLGAKKPEEAFFEAAVAALLLVDDTPANVDAARAAGWRAALWTGETRLADLISWI